MIWEQKNPRTDGEYIEPALYFWVYQIILLNISRRVSRQIKRSSSANLYYAHKEKGQGQPPHVFTENVKHVPCASEEHSPKESW
jgi:hypothetical protein